MSSESLDFSQEPKKVFLSFLIKQLSLASFYIYVAVDEARGLNALDGLIDSLNEASQKALEKCHEKVCAGSYSKAKVNSRELYTEVSKYLSKTYLEECQFGVVPTSTMKAEREAPAEKIPTRLKAGL